MVWGKWENLQGKSWIFRSKKLSRVRHCRLQRSCKMKLMNLDDEKVEEERREKMEITKKNLLPMHKLCNCSASSGVWASSWLSRVKFPPQHPSNECSTWYERTLFSPLTRIYSLLKIRSTFTFISSTAQIVMLRTWTKLLLDTQPSASEIVSLFNSSVYIDFREQGKRKSG